MRLTTIRDSLDAKNKLVSDEVKSVIEKAGANPDPTFPAGAHAYVQTSTSYEGAYGYNNVAAGTDWQVASVALPATMTGKPNWNLAQVQQVGIKVATGAGTGADAAVASGPPTAATIYVDSIWVE